MKQTNNIQLRRRTKKAKGLSISNLESMRGKFE